MSITTATKKLPGRYYALRCVQTRFRDKGDVINAWDDTQKNFDNNHDAEHCVFLWETKPVPNQVYAFVGLKT